VRPTHRRNQWVDLSVLAFLAVLALPLACGGNALDSGAIPAHSDGNRYVSYDGGSRPDQYADGAPGYATDGGPRPTQYADGAPLHASDGGPQYSDGAPFGWADGVGDEYGDGEGPELVDGSAQYSDGSAQYRDGSNGGPVSGGGGYGGSL